MVPLPRTDPPASGSFHQQGADKLTFNFLRMFVRQISFRFVCRYLGPSRTPVPTILFCCNCLSIYQFVVCIVCRWAGAASNSPTDKPLIRSVELSFYQAVAFAAGGASPSPTTACISTDCLCGDFSSASRAAVWTTVGMEHSYYARPYIIPISSHL